jgi:hypothetical protein
MNCKSINTNGNGGAIYFENFLEFEMKGGIFEGCLIEKCVFFVFYYIIFI